MITKSNSTKNIDKKIFTVQSDAPVIRKNSDNPYFKSKYAEYPEIQTEVRPLTIQQGLLVNFAPGTGNLLIMTVKDIETGEFYEVTMDLKTIQDSPQAQGSAITYGKRYMYTAFFDLIIEDAMDDDGNAGSNAKQKQNAATQQQPVTGSNAKPVDPNRPYLNPDTEKWFDAKMYIFVKAGTVEKTLKKYRLSKVNQETIIKQEELKPGSKTWGYATIYLSKEGSKSEDIQKAFIITDQDLQDLQIDAMNYTPVETIEAK